MKKCYLDSNILIAFKDEESSFHQKASQTLERLIKESYKLFISSLVLDEFLFQTKNILRQHKKKKTDERLFLVFRQVLKLPDLYLINPPVEKKKHLKIVKFITEFSLRPRDAYHLLIMEENKIGYFATFDNDFKKVFKKEKIKDIFSVI